MASQKVDNVAGESDFNTLPSWLMANTKDKEVRRDFFSGYPRVIVARAAATD